MMKKNAKKNNVAKKLIPAAGMLALSASMLATSTYAWFTMNREVSVTNMQVQAKAEGGLLISETAGHATTDQWDNVATANNLPTGVVLLPTSSSNRQAWYHANSKTANDEAGASANSVDANNSGYTTLNLTNADTAAVAGTSAKNSIYYTDGDQTAGYLATGDSAYYVKYTYYLKTSNESGITGMGLADTNQCLSIKEVTVTDSDNNITSAALNKSLRVGVAIGGKFYVFAPNYTGADGDTPADYYVYDGSGGTANVKITPLPANAVAYTDVASLNGVTTNAPLQADVYLWYEGEDVNCKSENVEAVLDTLKVDLKFELAINSGAKSLPNDNAKPTAVVTTGDKTGLGGITIPTGATGIKVDGTACADAAAAATAIGNINDNNYTHTLEYIPA